MIQPIHPAVTRALPTTWDDPCVPLVVRATRVNVAPRGFYLVEIVCDDAGNEHGGDAETVVITIEIDRDVQRLSHNRHQVSYHWESPLIVDDSRFVDPLNNPLPLERIIADAFND